MLRTDAPVGSGAVPPPEEVKLYAQRAACDIHPWAGLLDVCRIVDAKAQLHGMVWNPGLLRQTVCDELEAWKPALQEEYKRRRIQQHAAARKYLKEKGWKPLLAKATRAINNEKSASTGLTPNQAMRDYLNPPTPQSRNLTPAQQARLDSRPPVVKHGGA